jgi:hypothetical protein
MRTKWLLLLAGLSLIVFSLTNVLTKTSQDELAAAAPNQVLVASASRTDSTTSNSFVDLVPTPGFVFDTTGTSTIMVEFFGSARLSDAGRAMDIRAEVDGTPVNPGAMRFSGTGFTSISYAGFLSNVPAGRHTVNMQWLVTGGTGFMSNRTFIVWVIPQ